MKKEGAVVVEEEIYGAFRFIITFSIQYPTAYTPAFTRWQRGLFMGNRTRQTRYHIGSGRREMTGLLIGTVIKEGRECIFHGYPRVTSISCFSWFLHFEFILLQLSTFHSHELDDSWTGCLV